MYTRIARAQAKMLLVVETPMLWKHPLRMQLRIHIARTQGRTQDLVKGAPNFFG